MSVVKQLLPDPGFVIASCFIVAGQVLSVINFSNCSSFTSPHATDCGECLDYPRRTIDVGWERVVYGVAAAVAGDLDAGLDARGGVCEAAQMMQSWRLSCYLTASTLQLSLHVRSYQDRDRTAFRSLHTQSHLARLTLPLDRHRPSLSWCCLRLRQT